MTDITYEEAVEAVTEAEATLLLDMKDIIVAFEAAGLTAKNAMNALKASVPIVPGYSSLAKSTIDQYTGQIASYYEQTLYMSSNTDAVIAQYASE